MKATTLLLLCAVSVMLAQKRNPSRRDYEHEDLDTMVNGEQLFPVDAVQSSTHACSTPEICGPAEFCIDSKIETFCHTAHNNDKFPWIALRFSKPVLVTSVELEGYSWDRHGAVEVRITDTLPVDGNTKFTGGELFGSFTGSDAEQLVSLRNKPTQGTFVVVQRDQGKHPNNILVVNEIRVFGRTG